MTRLFLAFLLNTICLVNISAIPAYPRKVKMNINGKIAQVSLFGDEHSKRVENEEGYTIIQNEKEEWVYATLDKMGQLVPSIYKVGTISSDLTHFLSSHPFHLSGEKQSIVNNIRKAPRQPAIGQRRMLIIMMEFPDRKFTKSAEDFDSLFNQSGYCDDNAQGSVRDFFYRSSYGQLVLSCDVYGPYQTTKLMSNYGKNAILGGGDKDPTILFEEAIENVSKDANLRDYDGDKDGFIDNVHIIYAGYGEEAGGPTNAIWAHEATFSTPYEIQGIKIDRYSCAAELRGNSGNGISRIGPHCHEIGHALGAMDFYDTDYKDGGQYFGTGDWDLMASGSWNNDGITPADLNPYVKSYCYGWIDTHPLPEGNVIIYPSDEDKDSYFSIRNGQELYLFENRNPKYFSDGLPGKGLLIFHVHSEIEEAGNKINVSSPQMCYIVCASAKKNKPGNSNNDYGDINSESCPYPGNTENTEFNKNSTPMAFWWDRSDCRIMLHDIQLDVEGYISLYNDYSASSKETTATKELFFDGFEEQGIYSLLSSSKPAWERVKSSYLVDMVLGRPTPYEGEYSLQLSAKNSIGSSVSKIGFQSTASLDATTIQLSGFFISKGLNKLQSNLLRVGWCPTGNGEWEFYDYEVPVNDVWTPFVLKIPPSTMLDFSIEGTALGGSVLALDNIKVEQIITTSNKGIDFHKLPISKEIYDLSGNRNNSLRKGLNIVRESDGTIRKIFVGQK